MHPAACFSFGYCVPLRKSSDQQWPSGSSYVIQVLIPVPCLGRTLTNFAGPPPSNPQQFLTLDSPPSAPGGHRGPAPPPGLRVPGVGLLRREDAPRAPPPPLHRQVPPGRPARTLSHQFSSDASTQTRWQTTMCHWLVQIHGDRF